MKAKIIYIILLMAWVLKTPAQSKFNYSWVSGIFNTYTMKYDGNDFLFQDSVYSLNYINGGGGSNICDNNGDVKIMSNGFTLFNANKDIIEGGDSIGGRLEMQFYYGFSGYAQKGIILPFNNNIYYYVYSSVTDTAFNQDWMNPIPWHAQFNTLGYCKIDMSLNGGAGKVVEREMVLLPDTVNLSKTQMMACKHANGKDWWLLKQAEGNNIVYKFLVTKDSVVNYGIQSFLEPDFSLYNQSGQSQFSLDGTKYATTCLGANKVFVADFNRCSGMLSNSKVYQVPIYNRNNPNDTTWLDDVSEGLAFSPNGRFIYVSKKSNIAQLDLLDNDTNTQWFHVAKLDTTWTYFNGYADMYFGPDFRIYIGKHSNYGNYMSRINSPNFKGDSCNFCPRCLTMPTMGLVSPPCMPNYDLGMDSSLCSPAGTNQIMDWSREMEVYPNPTHAVIYLKNVSKKEKKLLNSVGQLLLTTNKDEIDVSCLNKGVYFLYCDGRAKRVIVD